jgi:hypothetical protein
MGASLRRRRQRIHGVPARSRGAHGSGLHGASAACAARKVFTGAARVLHGSELPRSDRDA